MDFLYIFLEPLSQAFFIKAIMASALVALVCGVTGCLVILRKMSFLGDAISHAMVAGVAAAYLFMKLIFGFEAHMPAMLLGALFAAIITVSLIHFVSSLSHIKEDTAIGIMYTGIFALGLVIVSLFREYIHIDLMHFIMGDILAVSDTDIVLSAISCTLVLSIIILFFRHFQLTSFDPVMATSLGMPTNLIQGTLTLCVSLVVVVGVGMVGVILVVGLLITPAATAYLLSDKLSRMMFISAFLAVFGSICGLFLAYFMDISGGGAIILFLCFQFLLALLFSPKNGIFLRFIKSKTYIAEEALEDILQDLLRKKVRFITYKDYFNLNKSKINLKKSLKELKKRRLIFQNKDKKIALTEKGREKALELHRSHRLWETYLSKAGLSKEKIHPTAHRLEHTRDPALLDSIDELLGHPVVDPYGSEIPQDPCLLKPGVLFSLSLLRPGQKAIIRKVPEHISDKLTAGTRIELNSRDYKEERWNITTDKGLYISLDHKSADQLILKMDPLSCRASCMENK